MTTEQVIFATISALVALLGVGLTIRNWVYGGSVVRVELELARREDWGTLVTGTVARWRQDDADQLLAGIRGTQVDLAKVTVRNLGRTAATVHDIGLRVGRPPAARGSWTAMANKLLSLGETSNVVRVEAHDVKVFYFHTMPLVRGARDAFGDGPLAFRGAVMTGVGKQRLSARWRRGKWNVWLLRGTGDRSILDRPLSTREQARLWVELTEEVYEPSILWVKQITDEAAKRVDEGLDRDAVLRRLGELYARFGRSEKADRDSGFMWALTDYLINRRGSGTAASMDEP